MVRDLVSFMLVALYCNLPTYVCTSCYTSTNLTARGQTTLHILHRFPAIDCGWLMTRCSSKNRAESLRGPIADSNNEALQAITVSQLLTDETLWGTDFPTILAYLEIFGRIDEPKVAVFSNMVVIAKPYKSLGEAQQVAERLNKAISELRANPSPLFEKFIKRTKGSSQPKAEVIPVFPEDESVRVAVNLPQLLVPGLTIATVRKQLGPPEKASSELVPTESERRPLILTLYSYAGGRVVFAEADIAPRPGFVNRVLIDVPAVTAALI